MGAATCGCKANGRNENADGQGGKEVVDIADFEPFDKSMTARMDAIGWSVCNCTSSRRDRDKGPDVNAMLANLAEQCPELEDIDNELAECVVVIPNSIPDTRMPEMPLEFPDKASY